MSSSASRWVSAHPAATAALLAVLTVAAIVLLALAVTFQSKSKHAAIGGFDTSAWKYGSVMDQGYFGGSLSPAQLSVYTPQLGGVRSELSRAMRREGLAAAGPAAWDPEAVSEAQALAAAGSYSGELASAEMAGRPA